MMEKKEMERKVKWEQQTKTPTQPNQTSLPWSLHHQTHTADDYTEEP